MLEKIKFLRENISFTDQFYVQKSLLDDLNTSFKPYIKNWYDVALCKIGLKENIDIVLRSDNKTYTFKDKEEYFLFFQRLWKKGLIKKTKMHLHKIHKIMVFPYKNRNIKFYYKNEHQMWDILSLYDSAFLADEYGWLDFKNQIVVDAGANVGDTAIYFAVKGAKHIYAYEPYQVVFNTAKKNISINKIKNKITLINEGLGRGGYIKLKKDVSYGNTSMKSSDGGIKIKIVSLRSIAERYKLHDALLKMDIEGSEYDVISNASIETLRVFKKMIIEYHNGYINLQKKLKSAGFRVSHTRPKTSDIGAQGLVFAQRI